MRRLTCCGTATENGTDRGRVEDRSGCHPDYTLPVRRVDPIFTAYINRRKTHGMVGRRQGGHLMPVSSIFEEEEFDFFGNLYGCRK